ncbi:unnamed protein product [Ranitomeya imitator]|uniref:tRNA (uracil-O(2)-)-methyltransferase n=1 Tax=Ranitomeya imitator TaxID=111125 RepID=A0ABN9LVC8_9NEOB|nr:unnamed protein product [Ranitomeya imitator]
MPSLDPNYVPYPVRLSGSHTRVFSDNTTAVAYLNHQGGTRSDRLRGLASDIMELAEGHLLSLSAVHIRGTDNFRADFLSRHTLHQGEWMLNRKIFKMITARWGVPQIDLFATRANRQVRVFASLNREDEPDILDALQVPWTFDLSYAFPPWNLLPLGKTKGARVTKNTLSRWIREAIILAYKVGGKDPPMHVLWEEERLQKGLNEKQSFVDLGCGNGLLVHILSNEGESAITPSDNYLFPDTDWIIGNHSDELTPWLPVIAARSSYSCRFFVLPCCFFNFYGKYNRKSSNKTQYREYLDFVTEVGVQCGFIVEEDCLRIPSTKRVCLIGKSRGYSPAEEPQADARRAQYISSHAADSVTHAAAPGTCEHNTDSAHDSITSDSTEHCLQPEPANWISGFRPRDKVEQVRNCASLPRDFTDKVVLQVAQLLLEEKDNRSTDGGAEQTWNNGRSLPLREVAEVLEKETLHRLKNECGGLQTLLRNNHQVFQVMNSMVSIRDWTQETQTASDKHRTEAKRKLSADALKTRLCWFYINHPSGCPRAAIHCPYAHGAEELRPSSFPKKHRP